MIWRLIPSCATPTPGQMAYDAELFQRFHPAHPPILRFFFFERPTVTLGRLEARRRDVSSLPFPHEVRPTGGRAVLHGEGDLCYAVVASVSDPLVGGTVRESYRKISGLLAYALRGLDRPARLCGDKRLSAGRDHCFAAPSSCELLLGGRKVAGGAQARRGEVFLQQGVILLSVDPAWDQLGPAALRSHMAGLNDDPTRAPLSRADVERAVVDAFREAGVMFTAHRVFPAVPAVEREPKDRMHHGETFPYSSEGDVGAGR